MHSEPVCHSSCGKKNVAQNWFEGKQVCGYAGMHQCLIKVCLLPPKTRNLQPSHYLDLRPFHWHFATQLTVLEVRATAHENQLHIGATVAKPPGTKRVNLSQSNTPSHVWFHWQDIFPAINSQRTRRCQASAELRRRAWPVAKVPTNNANKPLWYTCQSKKTWKFAQARTIHLLCKES